MRSTNEKAYKFLIIVVNAHKETLETTSDISSWSFLKRRGLKYSLSLLKDRGCIDEKSFSNIDQDVDELVKILFSILKSTRIKKW